MIKLYCSYQNDLQSLSTHSDSSPFVLFHFLSFILDKTPPLDFTIFVVVLLLLYRHMLMIYIPVRVCNSRTIYFYRVYANPSYFIHFQYPAILPFSLLFLLSSIFLIKKLKSTISLFLTSPSSVHIHIYLIQISLVKFSISYYTYRTCVICQRAF